MFITRGLLVLALFLSLPVQSAFNNVSGPSMSCSSTSGNATLNFFPGAPNGNYSFDVSLSGELSSFVGIGEGDFGAAGSFDFNIPNDEGGFTIPLVFDANTAQATENFTGGTVTINVTPGDSLTSQTGFGSASGTITISDENCSEPPVETECGFEFTSNGLQPSGASFQDDRSFKKHTALVGNAFEDLGGEINYSVSAEDPKELVKDRLSLVLARDPDYDSFKDLTELSFVGNSQYSKMKKVKLTITASDPSGEVMNYEHSMVLEGPFGLPCSEEEKPFTLTFKMKGLNKAVPQPPAFKFASTGAGEVKGEVKIVGEDSAIMSTATSFNVAETSMGKIGILPIGRLSKRKAAVETKKFKADAVKFATTLSKTIPDFLPLPTEAVDYVELPFLVFKPQSVFATVDKNLRKMIRANNLKKVRKMINLSSDDYIKSGKADVIISVFDSNTFLQVNDGSAAAFAYVGSVTSPGKIFVQTVSKRKAFSKGKINQRSEDAIHEIAHSYGFVGKGDTTCPPVIHNVNSKFADSCRITKAGKLNSSCKIKEPHIMGPSFPSTKITQCTFEDLTDRFKSIATSKKALTAADSVESLLLQVFFSNGTTTADLEPVYDSALAADDFLPAATDTSWYFDLRSSGASSVRKLYFEFDPELYAPDQETDSLLFEARIPLDDNFSQIALVNNNGEDLFSQDFNDVIPAVEITDAEFVVAKESVIKKQGESLTVSWEVTDSSGEEVLATVMTGTAADELVAHSEAFEITDSSVTLTGLDQDTRFVQVIVTNGSRSAKSEIVEI